MNVGSALDSTPREYRDQLVADELGATGQSALRTYAVQDAASR